MIRHESAGAPATSGNAPAPLPRSVTHALFAILGVALLLRIWGITFGLPYDFTPDEIHEIMRALKLGAGEYSWDVGKGGLYLLLFVEYGFLFVFWWLIGRVENAADFAVLYLQDPTAFYLAGRLTVAVMGAITCLVIFHIGRRIYDARIGLIAALIGATAHYHGLWSHYINVDIGMTLAFWASLLAYLEYERTNHRRWLAASGALAGIAVAFKLPGGLVLLPLGLALITPLDKWAAPRRIFKEAGIGIAAMLLTLAAISPETIVGLDAVTDSFTGLLGSGQTEPAEVAVSPEDSALDQAIYDVTIFRGADYLGILLKPYNLALTALAMIGALLGCWRRSRWDMIWSTLIVGFLLVLYAADRPGNERYMLPIAPALWLLGASAIGAITRQRLRIVYFVLAAVVVVPVYASIYQNYMFTRPDTRVLAKSWIEQNVPSGAKVLMDGMEYRFIQSPPLNPDEATVTRRVAQAEGEGEDLSRGVSRRTLELYARAMASITGPKYELHSTVWGLEVEDLSYYPEACFDLIVTSSDNSRRYQRRRDAERYPKSANFYRQLPADPRFREVFVAESVPWQIQGPTITVYEVRESCDPKGP